MMLQDLHDLLISNMPEDANHVSEECPLCNEIANSNNDNYSIGGGDMKTYTEDEFTTAVTEAVAPLQAAAETKVAELQAEIDELRTNQARTEVEDQVGQLQADLDKAEIRVAAAEKAYADLVSYLEGEIEAAEQAALVEARRNTRREAVKEAAPFADEYIDANLDRWMAMEDEAFESVIEDWKNVTAASTASSDEEEEGEVSEDTTEELRETAMSNVRNNDYGSVAADVIGARNRGLDVRSL
jgi:hypothetical protein